MGLLTGAFGRAESRSLPRDGDPVLLSLFGGPKTRTGLQMDEESAMTLSAVYRAVRLISESVAQLPLILYRRTRDGGRERATSHPLWSLAHDAPNQEQTSFEWREMLQAHLLLWGNAFAQKVESGHGETLELVPLHPARVTVERRDNRLIYIHRPLSGATRIFFPSEILHVPGLSFDGVKGRSPISDARESLGLTAAMEAYGAAFFGNDARPGGVLQHPGELDDEAHKRLKKSWREAHAGVDRAHNVAILEEGMKWQQVGMSSEDAQFLQSRQFQLSEVARWYGVPLHMLEDPKRGETFASIEQKSLEYVVYGLVPWLRRWETRMGASLLTTAERSEYFFEFLVDGLLRGNQKDRYEAYRVAISSGWMNRNEARVKENMNPGPAELDDYLQPLNMLPVGTDPADLGNDVTRELARFIVRHMARALPAPAKEPGARSPALEQRSVRARLRMQRAHVPVFEDAGRRVVKREARDVRQRLAGAEKNGDFRLFDVWLDEFYALGGKHRDFIIQTMTPALRAYAEAVHAEAIEEVQSDPPFETLEEFIAAYAGAMATRHVISSRGQLRALVRDGDPSEAGNRIRARLDEWEEKRPAKIAFRETVQSGNAFAWKTFKLSGVRYHRWVLVDNDPLCRALNGKTIPIDGAFLNEGEVLEVEGASPLKLDHRVSHPQLHQGCNCQIAAALEEKS